MPVPKLLERDEALRQLEAALREAGGGEGRIALLSGEAGIGKTSLVQRFLATLGPRVHVLKGGCDALFTPAPLAPLHDMARQTGGKWAGGRLLGLLESDAPRARLFASVLDELRDTGKRTVFVIEDIHWADEATLDLIRYLARRIAGVAALLVFTWRDDEVGPDHLLRPVLGDLATSSLTVRIDLPRLTVGAVRDLIAGRAFDASEVHRLTAGNPFFTVEVLSSPARTLPRSVRDAVLARAAVLGPAGRDAVDLAAVIGRPHLATLERILGPRAGGVSEGLRAGLLEAAPGAALGAVGDSVAFRHELVREVVLADLDSKRRHELSRLAFDELKRRHGRGAEAAPDAALLAYLADGAGDRAAVLHYGPRAARDAVAAGAHRAAAAHYRRVLQAAERLPPAERARFAEAYAEECGIVDDNVEAAKARRQAVVLWQEAGDRLKVGENLAELAAPLVRSGENAAAEEAVSRAVELLETLPPSRPLAVAYRVRAHLRMLDRDNAVAIRWGRKAISMACRLNDNATRAAAENVAGSAMLVDGNEDGRAHLERSKAIAEAAGLGALVANAWSNLGSCYGEQYQFAKAERLLADGIAFAREREFEFAEHYMGAWLALTRLYQGRWNEAGDLAGTLIASPALSAIARIMALVALGRVRARRGDPGAAVALDEALELASRTGTLQRLAPVHAARAELAWLEEDRDRARREADAVYELAVRRRHRWHAGELSFWRWRAGEAVVLPAWSAAPFRQHVAGDWRRAARSWEKLACPFEQARALADGDAAAQLAALETFDRLGAAPAAAALRQRMRREGRRHIPRGPRASTRRNPHGLTARELDILACLVEGLSNRRIGTRLHVSAKTVDHHVSAVLSKLGASTRVEAAAIARKQQLLAQDREDENAR